MCYYDGVTVATDEAKIGLTDRSVFFGDGVYDAMIGENGRIFLCEEHLDRLFGNAEKLAIPCPLPRDALREELRKMADTAAGEPFFLYVQLSRHGAVRTHTYAEEETGHLLITVDGITRPDTGRSLSLLSVEDRRYGFCDVKTVNLLPNVLAAQAARRAGADEAVFHRAGVVTECAHSNISILKNGTLLTHPCDCRILPGISRRHLLIACERIGIPYREEPFSLGELLDADAVLVTSTSKLCAKAVSLDGTPICTVCPEATALCREMMREYLFLTGQ